MIRYADASALAKRYVAEASSAEVNSWTKGAQMVSIAVISRAEVSAALNRAVWMQIIDPADCQSALALFRSEREAFVRLPASEITIQRADHLAYSYNLWGYDAVHLSCALIWQ